MPRGQDPQPVQGGQLNPYVQQSLQSGKQQAENRLLSATQEAGAMSRARMQEAGATQRTQMGIEAQQQMQAAQLEADDKRSAEAEAARREDQRFQKLMQEEQQAFLAEQSVLERDFQSARQDKQYDREDELLTKELDNVTLQSMIDAESSRQRNKVLLAMASMSQKGETAKQRMITSLTEDAEEADRNAGIHDRMKEEVSQAAMIDPRLSRAEEKIVQKPPMQGAWAPYREVKEGSYAMDVLQDQIRGNGSTVNVGDLQTNQSQGFVSKVASGELKQKDIRAAVSSLDGMIDALQKKKDDAASERDSKFWQRQLNDTRKMRLNLSKMMYDKTRIEGNDKQTVGSVIRDALGPIDGINTGSQIAKLKEMHQTTSASAEAYLEELRGAIEVPGMLMAPEGASPYLMDLIERRNQARQSAFPDMIKGGQ